MGVEGGAGRGGDGAGASDRVAVQLAGQLELERTQYRHWN